MFFKLFTLNFQEMFILLLRKNDICKLKKYMTKSKDFFQKKVVLFLFFFEKNTFLLKQKHSQIYFFIKKTRNFKFKNDCLKTVGRDIFLIKWSIFSLSLP